MARPRRKSDPLAYSRRSYRERMQAPGLVPCTVRVRETDLRILASRDVEEEARAAVMELRAALEHYIRRRPEFLSSLEPLPQDPLAPPLVRDMLEAGQAAGVGPMAAVAGAIAEHTGATLLHRGVAEVIVENGGDVFLARNRDCTAAVYAGRGFPGGRLGLRITAEAMPLGLCCSSASIGHSLSLGEADAVAVLAPSTALADAAATSIGNAVRGRDGADPVEQGLARARELSGISGVLILDGCRIGAWGEVELVPL